jgi:hypothetical protein
MNAAAVTRTVAKKAPKRSLDDAIERYKVDRNSKLFYDEIGRFRRMKSLVEAIKAAAESRQEDEKRTPYGHQQKIWNFWPEAIPEAIRILCRAEKQIDACTDFNTLLRCIEGELSNVHGLGDLYCYDVALRIGAHQGLYPQRVYLHAGVREGARRLDPCMPVKQPSLEVCELPDALQNLQPKQFGRKLQPALACTFLCYFAKYCRR